MRRGRRCLALTNGALSACSIGFTIGGAERHRSRECVTRAERGQEIRRFLSIDKPVCLSFRPSSVLCQPLHSSLCAGWHALNTNDPGAALSLLRLGTGLGHPAQAVRCCAAHPAHPGMSFFGNRLRTAATAVLQTSQCDRCAQGRCLASDQTPPNSRTCRRADVCFSWSFPLFSHRSPNLMPSAPLNTS